MHDDLVEDVMRIMQRATMGCAEAVETVPQRWMRDAAVEIAALVADQNASVWRRVARRFVKIRDAVVRAVRRERKEAS